MNSTTYLSAAALLALSLNTNAMADEDVSDEFEVTMDIIEDIRDVDAFKMQIVDVEEGENFATTSTIPPRRLLQGTGSTVPPRRLLLDEAARGRLAEPAAVRMIGDA